MSKPTFWQRILCLVLWRHRPSYSLDSFRIQRFDGNRVYRVYQCQRCGHEW